MEGVRHIKGNLGELLKKKWGSRVMHGLYMRSMDRQLIGGEGRFLWLSRGDLRGNNSSTRSGIANRISCNNNITNRTTDSK